MSDPLVRLARPVEYEALGALTLGAYRADGFVPEGSGYGRALSDARTRAEQAELYAAVHDSGATGALLGTVTFCWPASPLAEICRPGEAEFRMLAVKPAARGRGVAASLVAAMLERSRRSGAARVVICSAWDMSTAHRLYARSGFRRVPERDWAPMPHVPLLAFALELG
jgi:ribosomal protein S18 acetylase RimI-like enzyme